MTPKRFAVVRLARSENMVRSYLPSNYEVHSSHLGEPVNAGRVHVVIQGHDHAGWTLDGYVIPRLASGNLMAHEYPTINDAIDAACASMN